MARFAEDTTVPAERSRAELERLLTQHGAHQVAIAVDHAQRLAIVVFGLDGRRIKLNVRLDPGNLPDPKRSTYDQKAKCPSGWGSWTVQRRQEWVTARLEQFERSAWRRMLLVVKAKLELVRDTASSVEREFLADVMLPDGSTVHETLGPQLDASYRTGNMPPMLPGIGETG